MATEDVLLFLVSDVLPLLVSLAAFSVSAYTFYHGVVKPAGLGIDLGKWMSLYYTHDYKLRFTCTFNVFNIGARTGALVGLQSTINSQSEARSSTAGWRSFTYDEDIGKPGETFNPAIRFKRWADTVVVPGHSAVVESISFETEDSFRLREGHYDVVFTGVAGLKRRELRRVRKSFYIPSDKIPHLEEGKADPAGYARGYVWVTLQ